MNSMIINDKEVVVATALASTEVIRSHFRISVKTVNN